MIQVLVAIMGRDHQRAKDGYKRLAEHRHILIPVICGWARSCTLGIPGDGVFGFEIETLDGTTPGPRQLAVGRVVACVGNDDPETAIAVLDALAPLDCMLAGWDIARMAAEALSAAGGRR